jgi:hypothetical protein
VHEEERIFKASLCGTVETVPLRVLPRPARHPVRTKRALSGKTTQIPACPPRRASGRQASPSTARATAGKRQDKQALPLQNTKAKAGGINPPLRRQIPHPSLNGKDGHPKRQRPQRDPRLRGQASLRPPSADWLRMTAQRLETKAGGINPPLRRQPAPPFAPSSACAAGAARGKGWGTPCARTKGRRPHVSPDERTRDGTRSLRSGQAVSYSALAEAARTVLM